MNKTQTAQLASNKLIVKETTTDPEGLAMVPKFAKGITRLSEINTEIDSFGIDQEKDLTGITIDKEKTMLSLMDYTIEVAGAEHSYAHETGNHTLMSRVDYESSAIKHLTQPELLTVSGIILEEALKIPAEKLSDEGVSAEDLTTLKELIAIFNDVKSSPKEALIDRSGVTEKLRDLFAEARGIIKNSLDKLAPQYKRKAPEFYRRYKAARKVSYRNAAKKEPAVETTPEI